MCFLYRLEQKEIARTRRVLGILRVTVDSQEGSSNAPLGPLAAQFLLDIPTTINRFNELSSIYRRGIPVRFQAIVRRKYISYDLKGPSFYFFFSQYFGNSELFEASESSLELPTVRSFRRYQLINILDLYNVVLAYKRHATFYDEGCLFRTIFATLDSYQDKFLKITFD